MHPASQVEDNEENCVYEDPAMYEVSTEHHLLVLTWVPD